MKSLLNRAIELYKKEGLLRVVYGFYMKFVYNPIFNPSLLFYFSNVISNKFVTTKVRRKEFWINTKDEVISFKLWKKGTYEKKTTEFLEKTINKGDNVVDLGANIGYFTQLFSDLVGKNGRVFAFEPNPDNFKLLEKNTDDFNNVFLEKKAISNEEEIKKLYLSEKNSAEHTLLKEEGRNSINVETTTLDSYFSNIDSKIDFIKMDIEGSEPNAILGMKKLLKRDRPKLIIEFGIPWEKSSSVKNALDFLGELGYKPCKAFKSEHLSSNPNPEADLNELYEETIEANENLNLFLVSIN